jgi:hypothetical protein
VCARPPVYTHLRKGEREQRKKTFGKLIAGKKEMISRKKKEYTTTTMARKGEKELLALEWKTGKNPSHCALARIRTMNTQTFLKREICRWNKLLELER